ncbi:hypothetical protein MA9V2_250 [Chryseobacterium phage MA9V-2]|nr:hypothetical protein MA9V2_250 [Chryseobacterium phage MA9V-2]
MSEQETNTEYTMPQEETTTSGILNNMELAQKNPSLWLWIGIIIAIVAIFGYFTRSQELRIDEVKAERDTWKGKFEEVSKAYNELLMSRYYGNVTTMPGVPQVPHDSVGKFQNQDAVRPKELEDKTKTNTDND